MHVGVVLAAGIVFAATAPLAARVESTMFGRGWFGTSRLRGMYTAVPKAKTPPTRPMRSARRSTVASITPTPKLAARMWPLVTA